MTLFVVWIKIKIGAVHAFFGSEVNAKGCFDIMLYVDKLLNRMSDAFGKEDSV